MTNAVIPCVRNTDLKRQIEDFADSLRTESHIIGRHGLSEDEFYRSGILEGAIQKIRGQLSASMQEKRDFVARILRHMEDQDYIEEWHSAGGANRHDYSVRMKNGRIAVIVFGGWVGW